MNNSVIRLSVLVYTKFVLFVCEIMLKSVPGTNHYWAMRVKFHETRGALEGMQTYAYKSYAPNIESYPMIFFSSISAVVATLKQK